MQTRGLISAAGTGSTPFMYTVYILYSFQYQITYVGYTSDLINRFHSHNQLATSGWTVRYRPWIIVYTALFEEKNAAIKREKELKTGKGRDWIKANLSMWVSVFS